MIILFVSSPLLVRAAGWVSRQFLAFLVKQSSSWLLSSKLAVRIFVVTASLPDREGCLPLTYRLQVLKNSAVVPAAAFATCFRRFFLRWWTSLLPYLLRNHDCLLSLSLYMYSGCFWTGGRAGYFVVVLVVHWLTDRTHARAHGRAGGSGTLDTRGHEKPSSRNRAAGRPENKPEDGGPAPDRT